VSEKCNKDNQTKGKGHIEQDNEEATCVSDKWDLQFYNPCFHWCNSTLLAVVLAGAMGLWPAGVGSRTSSRKGRSSESGLRNREFVKRIKAMSIKAKKEPNQTIATVIEFVSPSKRKLGHASPLPPS
jgi:hypothetical protein